MPRTSVRPLLPRIPYPSLSFDSPPILPRVLSTPSPIMKVAIIGGGPAGLVTLKYLKEAHKSLACEPVEARLFEYHERVGGTFAARTYEDAELVSSRQLTMFSDFRVDGPEDFIAAEKYVKYMHDYCTRFDLWPHIKLRTRVVAVNRRAGADGKGHVITYKAQDSQTRHEWECDAVAVCSGLHVDPCIPHIPGIENVPMTIHSSQFKTRKQFGEDKTVMVVGIGETGSDMAHLAVTSPTRRVLVCHRDGFHSGPQRNPGPALFPILRGLKDEEHFKDPGIPIDVSRANIFDTAYVHPILRNSMLLWNYYDWYINSILWLSGGSTAGMDQWCGEISRERHHPSKIFFNKSTKIIPYLSQPYRPSQPGKDLWLFALRSAIVQRPFVDTKGRHVDLAPWPEEIDSDGYVRFRNNGRPEYERMKNEKIKPDIVVFATGYSQSFPFLNTTDGGKAGGERRYPIASEADVREVWKRDDPTVGFIGFLRPSFGAIPPLAEMQAQLWIVNLLAPSKIPRPLLAEDEPHYRLLPPKGWRITYGVDHESYVYQLAKDLDSAPGLWDVFGLMARRFTRPVACWKLFILWAFGANLTTKFRLQGPWQWDGAQDLFVSEEFWQTITRRPIFWGHFAVSILPMSIFGPLSLLCWIYATIVGAGSWLLSPILGSSHDGTEPERKDVKMEVKSNGTKLTRCMSSQ
ncbi:dimethylaniline monooxygenase [Drechmeria coniospora]|uniref:Dimethylaniline monooxygenase n=1 Tax=Drechmeria coniospora TaxID=98403 RepID=A0A151GNY0_DRECN|nr:dimethylaniline monooxygenase [Drechmeria coniospora]KYK58827.1 dimethylaniline monooxygenase [Drechmeria coniospora]ODA84194.1 hypothetical protein RJ55_02712 [Drechmeria coniospora]